MTQVSTQQFTDEELLMLVREYRSHPYMGSPNALLAQLILDQRQKNKTIAGAISPLVEFIQESMKSIDISKLPGFDMFGNFPPAATPAADVNNSAGAAVNKDERSQGDALQTIGEAISRIPEDPPIAPLVEAPGPLSAEEVAKQVEWDKAHPTQEEQERAAAAAQGPKIVSKTRGE